MNKINELEVFLPRTYFLWLCCIRIPIIECFEQDSCLKPQIFSCFVALPVTQQHQSGKRYMLALSIPVSKFQCILLGRPKVNNCIRVSFIWLGTTGFLLLCCFTSYTKTYFLNVDQGLRETKENDFHIETPIFCKSYMLALFHCTI